MWLILGLILGITFLIHNVFISRYRHLASPGPCLPVLGHSYLLFGVAKDPINGIWNIYKKFSRNHILYVKTFKFPSIWVGDFETLKFIFNHPDGSGRASGNMLDSLLHTRKVSGRIMPGVLFSEEALWHNQRRFTLKTLKDFGFGKQGMEGLVHEEICQFIAYLNDNIKEPIDFSNKLNLPIINGLWRITVGERFDYDNPVLVNLVERITEVFKIVANPRQPLLTSYPVLNYILPEKLTQRKQFLGTLHDVADMMLDNILKHKESLDVNSPRDFIDMMLIEIEKTTDESSSFFGQLGIDNLKVTLFDLFLAGSETTSTTLTWAALYMVRYPHIQEKVQQELDKVVGTNRLPSTSDRPNLPYTEAVIMEIQRHANIVPMGVNHRTLKDMHVNGQLIPADTRIFPIMAEILKGDHWQNGKLFNPDRFLDQEGGLKRDEHFIPFSIGKRYCLGETLAKTELFLFFTALVQQFSFHPEDEDNLPVEEAVFGITCLPKPFKTKLVKRV